MTLKQLIQFGQPPLNTATLLDSARYTKSELPVRLARRVKAFQNLPFIVGTNPYIMNVYSLYCNSFNVIRNFPEIKDEEADRKFTQLLKQTVNLHAENIPTLARGMRLRNILDMHGTLSMCNYNTIEADGLYIFLAA